MQVHRAVKWMDGWMDANPSVSACHSCTLNFSTRFLSIPRPNDARGSREMELEESDFLVFKPLGQKMTYRTISTEAIQPRRTDSPFLPPGSPNGNNYDLFIVHAGSRGGI